MNNYDLFIALQVVKTKDSNDFRQSVFQELSKQNKVIRVLNFIYDYLPLFLQCFLCFSFGVLKFFSYPSKLPTSEILGIYNYENERRRLLYLKNILKDQSEVKLVKMKLSFSLPQFQITRLNQIFIILKRICQMNKMLVSLRMSETLFSYMKMEKSLNQSTKLIILSSDSNPYAMAAMAISRKKKMRTCYINHGHIPEGPPRTFFDLNLLDGQSLFDVYKRSKSMAGETFFIGSEGERGSLKKGLLNLKSKENYSVGVFLSILTNWESVHKLLEKLILSKQINHILLRLHPNLILRDQKQIIKIEQKYSSEITISYATEIATVDLENCDLLIAGNSSVHLTSLKFGVPSILCHEIDLVPNDFYLFEQKKLVPVMRDLNISRLSDITSFYENQDPDIRVYFDASYNLDEKELEARIRNKILSFL